MIHSSGSGKENQPSGPRWRRWLLTLLLIIMVLAGMAWTSQAQDAAQATPTPGTTIGEATPQSTLPAYVGQDINQMTPIIMGGAILVLIILAGTLGTTRRHT